jgi:hypothetical protein
VEGGGRWQTSKQVHIHRILTVGSHIPHYYLSLLLLLLLLLLFDSSHDTVFLA